MSESEKFPSWDREYAQQRLVAGPRKGQLMRQDVYKNNSLIFHAGGYVCESGKEVELPVDDPMLQGTKVYSEAFDVNEVVSSPEPTVTGVVNEDCLKTAKSMLDRGLNPCVMNLADAAARAVDADIPLVRAAALYHDIGKINYPQCFTENEAIGVKYHADLTPKESAQEIIKHVSDGLALAEKHGLPKVLRDFINTHHGTTNTAYFYNRYLNEGGDPQEVSEFYYNGEKPTTKEQVILMLCDTIEAASRSLKDYSQENVSSLVDKIIEGKVDECQLSSADISLRELNILKDVIKSYLMQMHHSRVAYPKRKGGK